MVLNHSCRLFDLAPSALAKSPLVAALAARHAQRFGQHDRDAFGCSRGEKAIQDGMRTRLYSS
jgi:hypothetical protein